jgi:putative DNA primase/helicase
MPQSSGDCKREGGNHGRVIPGPALLRARGFALCKPDPGEKKPTYRCWATRSLEADDFRDGDLYGILGGPLSDGNRPGHALVIIDLDGRAALEKADDYLPPTGMEEGKPEKPRDHRYFLVPLASVPPWAESPAEQAAEAARQAAGHPGPFKKGLNHARTKKRLIDFIGTGGQVVCPSPGNRREWVGGGPGEPAVVPFPDLWRAVERLAAACGGGDLFKRVLAYLDRCDPAVSGENGHGDTYWPARVVCWGFDLGEVAGFHVLRDHFNGRCRPPWSDEELGHKCRDADTLPFGKPRGWLLESRPVNGPRQGDCTASPAAGLTSGTEVADEPSDPVHLTDLGNARRLVARHGGDLRHVHLWKTWLEYDGVRWRPDDSGEVMRRAKDTVDALYQDAAAAIKRIGKEMEQAADEGIKNALAVKLTWAEKLQRWALKSEQARLLEAMLSLARSDLPVSHDKLDADPFLFNVQNGTIDLRAGRLREHQREDFITKLAPVEYHPDATCPIWDRALLRWMGGNGDLVTYLQRVVGYGLTGDVGEQCLWFFHGTGANGKSTFLGTALAMLGDYAMQAVSDLLLVKNHEAHPTERADLFGKRFVATIETEEGKRMAEALMKQMTGGDKVRARRMRQDFFEFTPSHKIILAANHRPAVRGTDHAVWRRIKMVPFTVTIPEEEKDKALPEKLKAELPGILAWAVRGCLDWQRYGLGEPDEVRQATATYQAEQDTVQGFLAECCFVHAEARVKSAALLEAYHEWSGDRVMTAPAFRERLKDKGFSAPQRGHGGAYFWHGIGLPAKGVGEGR